MTGNPDEPQHRPHVPPPPLPGPVEDVDRPRTIIGGPPAEDTPAWRSDQAQAPATRHSGTPEPHHAGHLPARQGGVPARTIGAFFSETTRNGRWEVPAQLTVNQAFSEVLLDLREAVVTSPVVELQVNGAFMACKVFVPPGVPTEWAGGTSAFSESRADPVGAEPGPGWRLRVVHSGAFSEIRVRTLGVGEIEPKWWHRRR